MRVLGQDALRVLEFTEMLYAPHWLSADKAPVPPE
jgi:hypothetical protein